MALPAVAFPNDPPLPDEDRFIVVHGVAWESYCTVRELMDGPGVRMTYLKGALEIMSPSRRHELYKKAIARLIELYALERDIRLMGYGSTTFRKSLEERGLEPDECYVVDRELADDGFPDIALEIVMTSGGVNKLEVYRGLGAKEVWFWHRSQFAIYRLTDGAYEPRERSELLPDLDFVQLAEFAEHSDQHAALKAYRDALRSVG